MVIEGSENLTVTTDGLIPFWPLLAFVLLNLLTLLGGYIVWLFWRDGRQADRLGKQSLKTRYHA